MNKKITIAILILLIFPVVSSANIYNKNISYNVIEIKENNGWNSWFSPIEYIVWYIESDNTQKKMYLYDTDEINILISKDGKYHLILKKIETYHLYGFGGGTGETRYWNMYLPQNYNNKE